MGPWSPPDRRRGVRVLRDALPRPLLADRHGLLPQRRCGPASPPRPLPAGTRIEETERRVAAVEDVIRQTIPANEIDTVIDNLGLPPGGINFAFSDASLVTDGDGEILIAFKPEHGSTAVYAEKLRAILGKRFPDLTVFFAPADIVSQILNFGLAAPIDVQIVGRDPKNVAIAEDLVRRIAAIPGAADVRLQQVPRY